MNPLLWIRFVPPWLRWVLAGAALAAALFLAWKWDRERHGNERYREGVAACEAATREANDALRDGLREAREANRRLIEELQDEQAENEELARRLDAEATRDPGAGDPGLGSDSRLRLDTIR